MLNDKHDSYSVNSLLICAQAALLGGTASNHDVINLLDVAQDIISSTMNSFTDSSAPGANVDLFTKEVSASNSPALSFGQRILQARKSASLQQHHIASGAGVTVQAVSLWENRLSNSYLRQNYPIGKSSWLRSNVVTDWCL